MARTSQSDLDNMAAHLSDVTGRDLSIGWAYGQPRLEEMGGYRDVSPRLPSGQLLDYMRGMLEGISLASPHDARPQWRNGTLARKCQTCGHPIYHRGPLTGDGYGSDGWRHNPRPAPMR